MERKDLFSERYGHVVKQIQFESLDHRTRTFLWEEIYFCFFLRIESGLEEDEEQSKYFLWDLDKNLFSVSYLDASRNPISIIEKCKQVFIVTKWYLIFDIIEYTIKHSVKVFKSGKNYKKALKAFTLRINKLFEDERCAYRLVSTLIIPITNEVELVALADALIVTESIKAVNSHLFQAVKLFADRNNPDYRNSIKESILALESLLKLIVGDPNATMSRALEKIKKTNKISLHPTLHESLTKLYAWSGAEDGIRHGQKNESTVDSDDAKLIVMTCCSMVSYLIAKAVKVGLELKV